MASLEKASSHRPDASSSATHETPRGEARDPASEVEAGIREFVRNDVAYLRRPAAAVVPAETAESDQTSFAQAVNGSIGRASDTTAAEIDGLIGELETMREALGAQGERAQREMEAYVDLSRSTTGAMRTIREQVERWKAASAEIGRSG